ncbi:hypothetical protein [Lentibacter sp. XHP0401]|uniref:hypothetical protein n=1 Tax=Lentibacter sp. XHP0401 TaxID=2984334 RepID=UPI0021E814C6|nr:hypothetical protein [Lentibacter sp. XHP0401]MCV2894583.1 hypothetical protein [Lentibacter sp. XHP0401]
MPLGKVKQAVQQREGLSETDATPFYESDYTRLRSLYNGYDRSPLFFAELLYEDVVYFRPEGYAAISSDAINPENLKVIVTPLSYRLPQKLRAHTEAMVQFFKETRRLNWDSATNTYENNRTARVDAFDIENTTLTLSEASYFDQIGTNLSVDTNSGKLPHGMASIRHGFEPPVDGRLPPLTHSGLANSLGVAAMVFTPDFATQLLRVRSSRLASIAHRALHCTVSGVYELPNSVKKGDITDFSALEAGMQLEMRMELGLEPDEYDLFPVAFARELPRAGKPQLFFVARSKLPLEELKLRSAKAKESNEFISEADKPFHDLSSGEFTRESFTYEGWACVHFANQFLEANNLANDPQVFSSNSMS